MESKQSTVRLHLWLESGDMTMLGVGRAILLDLIEEHGSLRRAARCLGISYRAAWGKLRASEAALGVKLVENAVNKRDGCRLSEQGRRVRDMYHEWFQAVEREALAQAKSIFPWKVNSFEDVHGPIPGNGDTPEPVRAAEGSESG